MRLAARKLVADDEGLEPMQDTKSDISRSQDGRGKTAYDLVEEGKAGLEITAGAPLF